MPPYAQSAPEYVPPLTAKTPIAISPGSNWGAPAPSYDPGADAYGAYGAQFAPQGGQGRTPASLAHAENSASVVHAGNYVPGGAGEPYGARPPEPSLTSSSAGGAPYFWEAEARPRPVSRIATLARWVMTLALLCVSLPSFAYAGMSVYVANNLIYAPQVVPTSTPAAYGLKFQDVSFVSRTDHVGLQGWFIPGVGPKGALTDTRTIIVVHGMRTNRADPGVGLLSFSAALAKAGFAVLAFDMRGSGLSQAAPLSLGYYEQRDVLGAVDFLQSGNLPFHLGSPKVIGGWGVSMGAATLLLAAAQDPAIHAVVADSAYSDALPLLEREIPKRSGLPAWFTPGVLRAAQTLYGIDFAAVRPVAVVAKIAPRPILFIQGADDTYIPTSDMTALAQAAQQGSGAQVSTWLVPGATHAQAYKVAGKTYVDKVVAFFTTNLPVA